ncbi:hypothetical protein F5I97DRAFT_1844717 [Phlebopus sp. FC_14]|nr:hypothetical protein F5I97DRAFT_1844717 [Phlebopus sp. FC_14]
MLMCRSLKICSVRYYRVMDICSVLKKWSSSLLFQTSPVSPSFHPIALNPSLQGDARFLMVKLLLRKQDAWHRLDSLKYHDELGGTAALVAAMEELCRSGPNSSDCPEEHEQNVTDMKLDNKLKIRSSTTVEEVQLPTSPTTVQTSTRAAAKSPGFVWPIHSLAQGETEMDLQTMLNCLRLDELKVVAKQMQLKPTQKKDDLIAAMLHASASQTTLGFAQTIKYSNSKHDGYRQMKLPFAKSPLKIQQERLREIALQYLIKCIRINTIFCEVIWRANLLFFRLTQYTPNLLVDALLSRFKKRHYPAYEHVRTSNIWPTRQALLEYEEALILEGRVDSCLGGAVPSALRTAGSKTLAASSPLLSPETPSSSKMESKVMRSSNEEDVDIDVKPDSVRIRGARLVKETFECIYPRWQALVKSAGKEDECKNGLERFHCGHVLTRIICKCSSALGMLKEYRRELEVLEALLAQKRWRRGRRGRWYERRVSILCTHFAKDQEITQRALVAVVEALEDPDTHLCYRPKLQRRLVKLENALKLAAEDRHTCEGKLAAAEELVLEAVRVRHRAASIRLDRIGRSVGSTPAARNQDIRQFTTSPTKPGLRERHISVLYQGKPPNEQKGKTIWVGQNGEELDVEALALQRYENQGYKGVHCETRVLTMLFGLLFWDIIFAQIPGAFETPYQTAPLDIAEDSFYYSRKDLIERRLFDIENGEAADIIQEVDSVHRASGTWCVGVRWDLFNRQDLIDIVTCIGGKALSVICRVLCEDYAGRTSGGPDLFLWNPAKRVCKFVEVKGPGDTLQENQRVGCRAGSDLAVLC